MRIGATSFIYPADILTNVRKLAHRFDDIELLVFEEQGRADDLPGDREIAELIELGEAHHCTYTIHLPLDLALHKGLGEICRAARIMKRYQPTDPEGYVVHPNSGDPKDVAWLTRTVDSLLQLGAETGETEKICVENLDDQPPAVWEEILERAPISACLDIGHLLKQGLDPLPFLEKFLPRIRIVHLHGVGSRDHKGLSCLPESVIRPIVEFLQQNFGGVVTIEVFSERDLNESLTFFADKFSNKT